MHKHRFPFSELKFFCLIFLFCFLSFTSAVPARADFTFASWADTKSGTSYLATLSNQLKSLINPSFTIFEGDLEDSGFTQTGMDTWKKAINGDTSGATNNGIFNITLPVRGNHDSSNVAGWQAYFDIRSAVGRLCTSKGGTWNSTTGICTGGSIGSINFAESSADLTYSFDYDNAHIVGLDDLGDKDAVSAGTIAWLDADLTAAENRGATLSFIYLHGPIWPISYHCCTQSNPALDLVIYKHKSVAATLHGHEHIYAYAHINNARVPNTSTATLHEFEQFHTGNAGAEGGESCPTNPYAGCRPERWEYFMSYGNTDPPRGFTVLTVSGTNFTVKFYKVSTTTPDETMTFAHDTATGYTHCTSYTPYNTAVDSKLAAVCNNSTSTPTPTQAQITATPSPTTAPTATPSLPPLSSPTPTSPPGATREITFTESTTTFLNPERGFYNDFDYYPGQSVPSLSGVRNNGNTLAHIYLRFDSYLNNANIPVEGINTLFNNARQAKIKLIPRVTYNFAQPGDDATESIINQQLNLLKPVLEANKDVLYVWQAGFLGAWGEWHSSKTNYNLGTDGNGADVTTTKRVFLNILSSLPVDTMSALRYPGFRIPFFGSTYMTPSIAFSDRSIHPEAYVGFHNDCLFAGSSSYPDEGSYNVSGMSFQQVKDYYHNETQYVPMVGETCAVTSRTTCANITTELPYMRWSSLNEDYETNVIATIRNCIPDVDNRLGYRFHLQEITLPATISNKAPFNFHMEIKNVGYAPVYYDRPVYLVFENKSTGVKTPIRLAGADPRRWLPDVNPIVVDSSLNITSLPAGSYKLHIWMPDRSASIQNVPEYAIRLASSTVWSAVTGYNYLTDVDITQGQSAPGDANGDGKANSLDFAKIYQNFGHNVSLGASDGDFNNDLKVDFQDLIIWLTNYAL